MRRQRTRSRTKSEAKADLEHDLNQEENGVGDREIKVLRHFNGHAQGEKIDADGNPITGDEEEERSGSGSSAGKMPEAPPTEQPETITQPFRRDIAFADEVASPVERLPQANKEMSIAFVEKQRNASDSATFRIPGPRDYDRGLVPERINSVDDGRAPDIVIEGDELQAKRERTRSLSVPPGELNSDDHPLKNHITIDVPDARKRNTMGPSVYNMRRRGSDAESINPAMTLRSRQRTKTFGSFLSREREEEDPMPYLSWTATVGRNSAFVDLSEDQREELGGIEYRALKLLLVILICYFVGFHLFGMITLLPWIVRSRQYSEVVTSIGESPVWW